MLRKSVPVAFLLLLSGCALYNEVSVQPLSILPTNIERGADLQSMIAKADYLRAIEQASRVDAREKPNANDLAMLGKAYLAAGRYPEARERLRAALDLDPFRSVYAEVAWDLAQVEYLSNNYESSLDWAEIAVKHGLQIRPWHLDYLRSLVNVPVYRFAGASSHTLPFHFGRPDVPRVPARINGTTRVEAIIDSGAVLSIVSDRMARSLDVKRLGSMEGTFFGLLGEPIQVTFGLLESLELGGIVIENVPVAVMPDSKMRFLVNRDEGKEFRMDVLLGSHLLKEFRLELDFDRHRVTFTRLTDADRRPDANQNLFMHGFRPHVRGSVNRRGWFLFVLDTGSEITFLNEGRASSLPLQFWGSGGHTAMLQGLGGAMKRGSKLEDVEVGIDKWAGRFRTIPMYGGNEKDLAVGIIGQNLLEKFNVVIDFGRMRVDLERR